ncbi:MAG TPA: GNAT family N-acetyltransferase [Bacteroidales bacterium]|nr:GNAT family N-acetyltransferase [Bacteroidales bacterium]
MNIQLRPATEADFPEILGMIKELALFEKAPEKVTNSVEQMQHEKDFFHCIMAENEDGTIVGMALYFFAYYTWVGKSLYLDDLYIKPQYRGNGIGTMLLKEIMNISKEEKCTRIRWQVLDWNTPAIDLYKKMGMTLDGEWINCDWINEK